MLSKTANAETKSSLLIHDDAQVYCCREIMAREKFMSRLWVPKKFDRPLWETKCMCLVLAELPLYSYPFFIPRIHKHIICISTVNMHNHWWICPLLICWVISMRACLNSQYTGATARFIHSSNYLECQIFTWQKHYGNKKWFWKEGRK